jgi:hypothetical protein
MPNSIPTWQRLRAAPDPTALAYVVGPPEAFRFAWRAAPASRLEDTNLQAWGSIVCMCPRVPQGRGFGFSESERDSLTTSAGSESPVATYSQKTLYTHPRHGWRAVL